MVEGGYAVIALLYVQADGAVLVESEHPAYDDARHTLNAFADLTQRIDPLHVYRIQPVSLWQAAALGYSAKDILAFLRTYSAHPLPFSLQQLIVEETAKWGQTVLQRGARHRMVLRATRSALDSLSLDPEIRPMIVDKTVDTLIFSDRHRAWLKRTLVARGLPVLDRVGYRDAPSITFELRRDAVLRPYQRQAIEQFLTHTSDQSGVVVLPCGAGKTVVAIGILARLQMYALVLTPSHASAEQWQREILKWTTLPVSDVRMYEPDAPPAPITITTYQQLTTRNRAGALPHLAALTACPWGIVVYDEVHMLPAPLFRLAADLQSARRLGLTATLVREDGAEADVFSLIGPKCFEVPWRQLEQAGYLAAVRCVQVQVPLEGAHRTEYMDASARDQHRLAAENPVKEEVVQHLVHQHAGESTLIIGHYLSSLQSVAKRLQCPLITGKTPQDERSRVFEAFRRRELRCVALSRVANLAIDLPCASVAIQISGLFGSRQEEAQRLGRLLRPESEQGVFYTLVSSGTVEERMATRRQLYLVEQGYTYERKHAEEVLLPALTTERMDCCETVGVPEHC